MKGNFNFIFFSCIIIENKLFCVTEPEHIFITIDIETGKVDLFDTPEGYFPDEWNGTDRIVAGNMEVYLLETNGKRMIKYSLLNNSCQYLDINCKVHSCSNYIGTVVFGNTMYIVPRFKDEMIKVDLLSNLIKERKKLCKNINYEFNEKEKIHKGLYSCSYQIKNNLWIFTERNSIVIKYNILTEEIARYVLPDKIKGCVQVAWGNQLFYILALDGKTYSWNYRNNDICELYGSEAGKEYPYFGQIIFAGYKLWLLPFLGEEIVVINLITGEDEVYKNYPADFRYSAPDNWCKFSNYCEDQINYYFAMHSGNYILVIDKKYGIERWLRPDIDMEKKAKYFQKNNRNDIYIEIKNYNIGDIIGMLKISYELEVKKKINNNVGKKMWDKISKNEIVKRK